MGHCRKLVFGKKTTDTEDLRASKTRGTKKKKINAQQTLKIIYPYTKQRLNDNNNNVFVFFLSLTLLPTSCPARRANIMCINTTFTVRVPTHVLRRYPIYYRNKFLATPIRDRITTVRLMVVLVVVTVLPLASRGK